MRIAKLSVKHKNVKQSKLYKKATENESLRKCVLCFVVTRESSISRVSLWSVWSLEILQQSKVYPVHWLTFIYLYSKCKLSDFVYRKVRIFNRQLFLNILFKFWRLILIDYLLLHHLSNIIFVLLCNNYIEWRHLFVHVSKNAIGDASKFTASFDFISLIAVIMHRSCHSILKYTVWVIKWE